MAVTWGRVLFAPEPGHTWWCTKCKKPAQARHVRERVQLDPPDRYLYHTSTLQDASECGGRIEQRRKP